MAAERQCFDCLDCSNSLGDSWNHFTGDGMAYRQDRKRSNDYHLLANLSLSPSSSFPKQTVERQFPCCNLMYDISTILFSVSALKPNCPPLFFWGLLRIIRWSVDFGTRLAAAAFPNDNPLLTAVTARSLHIFFTVWSHVWSCSSLSSFREFLEEPTSTSESKEWNKIESTIINNIDADAISTTNFWRNYFWAENLKSVFLSLAILYRLSAILNEIVYFFF